MLLFVVVCVVTLFGSFIVGFVFTHYVVELHEQCRGEHLPAMDGSKLGLTKGGIDAFVAIEFAGNPKAKTKYKTVHGKGDLHMAWNTELWMPVCRSHLRRTVLLSGCCSSNSTIRSCKPTHSFVGYL